MKTILGLALTVLVTLNLPAVSLAVSTPTAVYFRPTGDVYFENLESAAAISLESASAQLIPANANQPPSVLVVANPNQNQKVDWVHAPIGTNFTASIYGGKVVQPNTPGTDLTLTWTFFGAGEILNGIVDEVPEPSSIVLLGMSIAAAFRCRRSRVRRLRPLPERPAIDPSLVE